MARENRTRYAVLGLLVDGECTGYDLKKRFEAEMSHFWAESVGQIYPALRQLEDEGLVRARAARGRGHSGRTLYRLAPAGRAALRAWLAQPPAPDRVRNELLLKLSFGRQTTPRILRAHVEHLEHDLRARARLYKSFEEQIIARARSEKHRTYWMLCLRSGQLVVEARLRWCREAREALASLDSRGRASRRRTVATTETPS